MTKPLTPRRRREFMVNASQHLRSMRAALIHELASVIHARRSANSGDSLDSADLASKELEQNMTVILSERERERIIEIDHALRRMDEANYGVCETCGLEISEQRLKVMPFTRYCHDCQHDQERAAKTWYRGDDNELERHREVRPNSVED
jgi:DnaK suppressor protein